MRKSPEIHRKVPFPTPRARRVLAIGLPLILLSLLRLLFEVQGAGTFPRATAAYFGGMLEYPVAALALLTGGALLVDLAERSRT